jgi:hypothetical protein
MENERRRHNRPGHLEMLKMMLTDRKLQRKERHERKLKQKAHQRHYRKKNKTGFLKRMGKVFSSKDKPDLEIRIIRRKIRADRRQMFLTKLKSFFRNPYRFFFPKHRLDLEQQIIREKIKQYRRKLFLKAFVKYLHNPLLLFYTPRKYDMEEQIIRRKIRQDRRNNLLKWIHLFFKNPIKTLFKRGKPDQEIKAIRGMVRRDKKENMIKRFKENISTLKQIFKTHDLRVRFSSSLLQSTGYYLLSFMLMYTIYQLVTILITRSFDIPCIWYYYRIKWPLYTYSAIYSRMAMVSIFSSGPIVILLLTMVFFRMILSENKRIAGMKLFLLWCAINGTNMFFGSYIVGFITRTEFIYSTEWLFMNKMFAIEEIFFALIALVVMVLTGRFATRLFLLTSGSATLIKRQFRFFFILSQVFFPWLIGAAVLFILTIPGHYLPLTLKTLTPVIMIIPMLLSARSEKHDEVFNAGILKRSYTRKSIIILIIVFLFLYRLILNSGLHFGK